VYNNSVNIGKKTQVDLGQDFWTTGNPEGKLKEDGGWAMES
jgi:hypothetical protein